MAIIATVMIATALPSQAELLKFYNQHAPVVVQFERQQVLWSIHEDGMVSAVHFNAAANAVEASIGSDTSTIQQRLGDPPLPTVTTTWTDANGVSHSVSTPFPALSPAAMRRLLDQHNQLVTIMQGLHPPAPPKPAPTPTVPPGP